MSMEGLSAALDPAATGDWIASRVDGFGSTVAFLVPRGFAACARVLHPAWSTDDEAFTRPWRDVCGATGRVPHALMQWQAIARPAEGVDLPVSAEGLWDDVQVETGNLAPHAMAALVGVLARFTDGQPCHHALWEGFGWLTGSWSSVTSTTGDPGGPPPPPSVAAPVPAALLAALAAPRLRLPGRDHLLFTGPLEAALALGHQVTADWFLPQSPTLLWPADRSWFVATEIDLDSTLVAGPQALVDAVVAAPDLEAWAVTPDSDLGWTGDQVNG